MSVGGSADVGPGASPQCGVAWCVGCVGVVWCVAASFVDCYFVLCVAWCFGTVPRGVV